MQYGGSYSSALRVDDVDEIVAELLRDDDLPLSRPYIEDAVALFFRNPVLYFHGLYARHVIS